MVGLTTTAWVEPCVEGRDGGDLMTESDRTVIGGSATAPLSGAMFSCATARLFGFGFGADVVCGDAGLAVAAGAGVAGGDAVPGVGVGGGGVFCAKAIDETVDSKTESAKGTAQ